jgi:quinol monooxygenase YgiN
LPNSRANKETFKLAELLEGMSKSVLSNEPSTLRYQIHREINKKTGEEELVMIEGLVLSSPTLKLSIHRDHFHPFLALGSLKTQLIVMEREPYDRLIIARYTDMEAVKLHGSTKEFKAFYKIVQEEDLTAAPTRVQILKAVGGFASRL